MSLADARKNLPLLASLDDEQFVDALHRQYYPQMDKAALAAKLGYTPPEQAAPQAGLLRSAGDVGIKLAQGAVDLGSSVVGLGSLATGGAVGKGMRTIGYDPKATNDALGQYLSDSQKAADAKVSNADGFVDTVAASVQNPRSIVGSIAQSAPGMLAGMGVTGAVARGIAAKAALATGEGAAASAAELAAGKSAVDATGAALATKAGATAAQDAVEAAGTKLMALGSATEGAQSAGKIADDAQAAGRGYADYAAPALAAGVGTAAIGYGAGKLMGDAATELATGARSAGVKGGMAARVGKEFLSEGVLEEMPQSAQEQVFTNAAMGEQDLTKGVGNAAGAGLVTGGVMGAGLGAAQRNHAAPAPEVAPTVLPNTGPLSQAANAGQQAAADKANAAASGTGVGTPPAGPSLPSMDQINARLAELDVIARGAPTRREKDGNDIMVTVPSVKPRKFTPEELAEFQQLMEARAARAAIPEHQRAEYEAMLQEEAAPRLAQMEQQRVADKQAAEDAQMAQLLAEEAAQQRQAEQEQARAAAQKQRQEAEVTNAIVEHERAARAQQNRAALRAKVLTDATIPAPAKKAAFRAALKRDGYIDTVLNDEDHAEIERATAPVPSAPNELVDAVPERVAAPAAPAGVNTQAVDTAIAAGMRLKTPNGTILHKPGSSKVFKLSTAQKAHYQKRMQQAAPDLVDPTASAPQAAAPLAEPAITAPVAPLDVAAHEAATSPHNDLPQPTEGQKEANNYKVGRIKLHGLDISIENPAGSVRSGVARDGTPWQNTMQHHYGYIRGTVGADKDHIDTFIGPSHASDKVFVVDQVHPDSRKFDEHKVMLAFDSMDEARAAYLANYAEDWTGGKRISETTVEGFKKWLAHGQTRKEYTHSSKNGIIRVADIIPQPTKTPAEIDAFVRARETPAAPPPVVQVAGTPQDLQRVDAALQRQPDADPSREAEIHASLLKYRAALLGQPHDGAAIPFDVVFKDSATDPELLAVGGIGKQHALASSESTGARAGGFGDTTAEARADAMLGLMLSLNEKATTAPPAGPAPADKVPPGLAKARALKAKRETPAATTTAATADQAAQAETTAAAPAPVQFAANKIFTNDAVERARARLKSKIGQLNSGFDPEMMQDGITIAGAYIESGVRQFADFTRAMVADLGEGIRPYLRSFYEGARHYPGLDTAGMSTAAEIDALGANQPTAPATAAIGTAPKAARKTKAAPGNAVLRQDFGVEHVDGYEGQREDGMDGVKGEFIADAQRYLKDVTGILLDHGWDLRTDAKGKAVKPVQVNEAGIAVSGDVSLQMFNPTMDRGVYVNISGSSLRGVVPTTKSGIAVMMRFTTKDQPYSGDQNRWMDPELSARDLADHINEALARITGAPVAPTVEFDGTTAIPPGVKSDIPAVEDATAPAASAEPAPGLTTQELNRLSVKDMTDAQLQRAATELPKRAEPVAKEIARRAALAPAPAVAAEPSTEADVPVASNELLDNTEVKEQHDDPTSTAGAPALDSALHEGQRADAGAATGSGAKPPRARNRRLDAGSVRGAGQRVDVGGVAGETQSDPRPVRAGADDGAPGSVAVRDGAVHARDFVPGRGGLTREGSWFDAAKRNIDLIDLALRIEQENRPATAAEQSLLAKYVGFGAGEIRNALFPIPPASAKQLEPNRLIWPKYVRDARWQALAERVEALPREWQKSILQSSQYAHYTSEGIIRSVWGAMDRLGFTGGKVFEPGMGIGSFSMLMPEAMRQTSRYTGVEFDGPTASIAKLISPEQNVLHDDFIKRKFPTDYFDVAIGNPPFSQTKIFGDADYEKFGFMLHDFFFAKSIDRVRPGGLLAFVTSKGTMDKQGDKARKYLAERADLVGAIRLPSTAFESNAGTSVVTDVIFLRKRLPGQGAAGPAWNVLKTIETQDGPVAVNEYFADHPAMVLGQQRISGNVDDAGRRIDSNGRGGEKYTVVSYDKTPAELDAKFAAAVLQLPQHVYSVMKQSAEAIRRETAKVDFDPTIQREGVIYLGNDGALLKVEQGVGVPLEDSVKLSEADRAWFKDYVGLRDAVQATRQAQHADGNWEASLKALNAAYDAFRATHGPVNDFRVMVRKSTDEDGKPVETETRIRKNNRRLREDYDQSIVVSLESITEAGEIVKAPFLLGRTIGQPATREVKSIGDALNVSLDSVGALDLDDVGRRIGLSRDQAIEALGAQVYRTPDGQWQLTDEYLSGDVVRKLEEAEQAARLDPGLQRNVEALKAVQPEKLGPSQISAKLGASWVPAAHVNAFAEEIGAGAVAFDPQTESWQVDGGNLRSGRRAGAEYGTAARSPSELLEAALNSRSVKIVGKDADGKSVTDVEATTAANEAMRKIKDKFKGWIWTDSERASELVESYNKRYNNIAPRRFDGSHLTLPGVSLRFKLHPHQLRAIWRMIQTGNTYLAHAVGAGKTIEMIAAGMEQKRLGLINKPMYVVPNHMLEQFANEFMELYPLANIMVADDENFSSERRRAFVAAATMNNPDAIVITHDAFQRIGVKEESVAPIRDAILSDLEIELSETAKDSGARVRRSQLEQQIEAVTQRFERIVGAGGKDATLKFEDIGVDFVFADEAHVYRKLDFHTAQQIKGIDPNGSKRALDMYVKTRWLESQRPGRSFGFASGTPVTNTMGELYTIMRFFSPAEMDRAGISTFDAWARQFGEVAPALEPNAAGKYELIERFAKFDNVPELMSRVRQFMDVLTSDNLGALVKRPDLIGGKPNLNIVQPTGALESYMKNVLGPRIEVSKNWKPSKDQPNNPDPIVAIITDGRFAALDPRFFGAELAEGEHSIITEMGDKVVAAYHAGSDNAYLDKAGKPKPIKGSTQLVFYNLGFGEQSQQSRGFNSRAAFTKRLTDGGVARGHIAWFDDANTDAKKEAMFKDMRSGKLRILIGSAKKMGTGVNVQKRLAALHYQDPPWFPADVEQPHGRIIRQGNQNPEVGIEWYTTKGTYQSTMWQMVARKQRFIDQAFTGDKTMRSMDDMGEASLFEQAAAVASGDPRAIQLAGLKQDVMRFERLQAAHANEQIAARGALRSAEWQVESATLAIATYSKAFDAIGGRFLSFTEGEVGGATYDKMGEFGQAIKDAFNQCAADSVLHPPAASGRLGGIGGAVAVTMEGVRDPKTKRLTGEFELLVEVGGHAMEVASGPGLGADVDATGLARRIVNKVNGIEPDLRAAQRSKASGETDMVRLRKKLGAPFEYQQEMLEKYGDLTRLEEELRLEGAAKPAALAAAGLVSMDGAAPAAGLETQNADGSYRRQAPADGTLEYFRDAGEQFDPVGVDLAEAPAALADPNAAAAPGELSTAEMAQAKKDETALNARLAAAGMAPVRVLRRAPNQQFALARKIGAAFGVKVNFIEPAAGFEGVAYRGVAYIAEGMRHPELAIAGHETLHALDQQNPELGERLRMQIRAYLGAGVVDARREQESFEAGAPVSSKIAEVEVLADINGAMWMDPLFWRDLARADRNLFRQAAYLFMQAATRAIAALRGARFDVAALVSDVAAVREIMVAAWAEHNAGRDAGAHSEISPQHQVRQDDRVGYNDIYENITTRPGTTDSQRQAGRAAVNDLSRRLGADRIGDGDHADRGAATVLGSRLLANFIAGQANQLIGQVAKTPADLVALAQVYRDPRFETFRVLYAAGGVIAGEAGYTSRLPASVAMPANLLDQIAADKARFAADGYYILHNHPSGAAEPSSQDIDLTRHVSEGVPGMLAHVVIDHNEYAVIEPDGRHEIIAAPELNGRDFTAVPELAHHLLGFKISGPGYVAQLAKSLQIPAGHATLVLTEVGGKVQLLVDVPMGALADMSKPGIIKGKALMRRMARDTGSGGHRFIVLPAGGSVDQFAEWVRAGVVSDVVSADAETTRMNGAVWPGDFMGENAPVFSVREGHEDGADPSFSRAGIGEALANAANNINAVRLPANYLVGDLFNQSGKLNWWHKTIGTMDNLARRHPDFAKVYEAVQAFIGDVSRYAVVAADLAPTLLPKLENVADVFGANRKKPLTAADTKAIGAPIFEGTLVWARDAHGKPVNISVLEAQAAAMTTEQKAQILLQKGVIDDGQNQAWQNNRLDFYEKVINSKFDETQLKAGVIWADAELRAMFHLNDAQIGMYREFRAALDKSLTNLSISEMVKMGGKDAEGMLDQAVATGDIEAAGELLRDRFVELAREFPNQATMHLDTAKQIMNLADKGRDLIERGYAPLARFGKYTVYVQDKNEQGELEQVYFGMFETQFEASKMARKMRDEHPGAEVAHGTVSEEEYKLFAGVSPETIELFGSMVGLDSQADAASTEVYQTYLKLAKNNRSSMKRLIQRKGIAGFSEDAGRVLAGFIYSNARLTAGNAHLGEIDQAVTEIPRGQGELKDAAIELRDHIKNPEGGGNKLGGLMFAQFLGGSVASAMVNLTQPFTMTLPFLSQYGGLVKAGAQIAAAVKDSGKKLTGDAGLDAAMQWATDEGIVAPQEVHYLQAQAAGKGGLQSGDGTKVGDARAALNNTMTKVMVGWGKLFAMAEVTNRRVTFIAAYRTAVQQGMADPARFAEEAVTQTQGMYNSGNKPVWARGAIGGLAMTFKQYSISYLELLSRMAFAGQPGSPERAAGRRGALYMVAVLFLMSGADGLPFEQDLEDALDGIMQRLGYNFSTKRAKQAFLTDVLGSGAADFALKGISSMPGMPVDVAGRFGMGNLIPATGLLTKKESYTSDLGELAGPAGDLAKRAFSATGKALSGDLAGAALDISPVSVRNVVKGVDMASSGAYNDARGYKVNEVTPIEAAMKAVGFQPNSTANIQDAKGQALNMISQNRMRSKEISEHWAQGIAAGDEKMVREARAWRDDWNEKNPETRISVNMPALQKRVRSMRQDAIMRTQMTAPKALKQSVRGELAETR